MANKPTYRELEEKIRALEKEASKASSLEKSVHKTRDFAKSIVDTIREPLVILDDNFKIITATPLFYKSFRLTPRQIQGKRLYEISNGQWDILELRTLLEDILVRDNFIENFEIEHHFKGIGPKILHINARRTHDDSKKTQFVLLAIEDVTEQISTKREILERETRLKEAEKLALLGHWELDLITNTLFWSDEIFRIFELDAHEFGATYEAFLMMVHPDDRDFVNDAYKNSVKKKSGYNIDHRLLLRNGKVKYVHERCKTEYDKKGTPLRSLGTVQDITERVRLKHGFAGLIGRDVRMRELFATIKELTDVNIPVLIQGESGTGKELVAAAIHNEGPRAQKPFVPVNCSALPEGLLESELFGHVKGAFTGALRDKKGRFELAHGGTLFLDEIADLPKVLQVKLLRVLQEGSFERVGGEETISADVRIISAANRDLKQEVEKGNFRDDLFYRINVVPIFLPPLRERKNDIPLLVENFLEKSARMGQVSQGISNDALAVMVDYAWPGNVRELQSAIRFALVKSKGKTIRPEHLPPELNRNLNLNQPHGPSRKLSPENVRSVLTQTGGNKAKAAKLLGVGRATLYRFIASYPDLS